MFEVFVLKPVRRSPWMTVISAISLLFAVGSLILTCGNTFFGIPFVIFGLLWYYLAFQTNTEYEYSYFDGEVRFARILNKSRRKTLEVFSMDAVAMIAPAGDRSVYKYEQDKTIKVKDYTSHQKDVPYYELVVNKDAGGTVMIKYEPDDEYLDAIQMKYAQKVIRRQA